MVLRTVSEVSLAGDVPRITHPEWSERFPWLCQGMTVRGARGDFDMGLFGPGPSGEVQLRWDALGGATGFASVVHGHQIHGTRIGVHHGSTAGRLVVPDCDGHLTATPGTLLTVATADCVPVFMVSPEMRAIALLHAGWRGVAAGVLERGVALLASVFRADPTDLHAHLGPAICGDCYEVGPEVHEALDLPGPEGPEPVDLRAVLGRRALALGVSADRVTVSAHCTLCGDGSLFSHRGGDPGRQVAMLGLVGPT